jgi:hypothetical protein
MSLTVEPASDTEVGNPPAAWPPHHSSASTWLRVGLAIAFLGVAGGVRLWQTRRIDDFLRLHQDSPFPLKEIPLVLGEWKGQEDTLPPDIARATGCRDYVNRTYVDARTGVRISVIILFGPPMEVIEHAPEKCYPLAGYSMVEGPLGRSVPAGDHKVDFSSMIFQKGEGGNMDRQEVYYTWHYGRWTPVRALTKQIERTPGMYKVHVARRAAEKESLDQTSPCESFLATLIPEIDKRMATSAQRLASASPSRPAAK